MRLQIITLMVVIGLWVRIECFHHEASGQRNEMSQQMTANMDDRFRGADATREFKTINTSIDQLNEALIKLETRLNQDESP